MAFPYVRANADWKDAASATGGGDTSTPITATAMDTIEAGIESLSDILELADAPGDFLVASGADAWTRLAKGSDDEVLSMASGSHDYRKIVNAMVDSAAAIARSKLAVQTRRYPIHLHTPRSATLAGNAFWTVAALTDYDAGHWEFVKDVEGKVYGHVLVPAELADTPNAKVILSVAASATTGVTRLQVGTKDVADAESLNPSLIDETAQDITVPGTAYLRKDVTFTLTNAPAANDYLIVEVFHDGDHANDTLAVNTLLFGAWLEVDVA